MIKIISKIFHWTSGPNVHDLRDTRSKTLRHKSQSQNHSFQGRRRLMGSCASFDYISYLLGPKMLCVYFKITWSINMITDQRFIRIQVNVNLSTKVLIVSTCGFLNVEIIVNNMCCSSLLPIDPLVLFLKRGVYLVKPENKANLEQKSCSCKCKLE